MNSKTDRNHPGKREYPDRPNNSDIRMNIGSGSTSDPMNYWPQRLTAIVSAVMLIFLISACDNELTGPDSETLTEGAVQQAFNATEANQRPVKETVPLIFDPDFEPGEDGVPETAFPLAPDDEPITDAEGNIVEGYVTLTRRANGTFDWKLEVSGMQPGDAYTLWILNGAGMHGDLEYLLANELGGNATGGLVSGQSTINAAGNHCVGPFILAEDEDGNIIFEDGAPVFETFGFVPGVPPSCDIIDTEGSHITFVLLEKGPWTPGDIQERWLADFVPLLWATFDLQ